MRASETDALLIPHYRSFARAAAAAAGCKIMRALPIKGEEEAFSRPPPLSSSALGARCGVLHMRAK